MASSDRSGVHGRALMIGLAEDYIGKIRPWNTSSIAFLHFMRPQSQRSLSFSQFVCVNFEMRQRGLAETGGQRHVGGVASASDENPPNAWHVVARVERVPGARKINLEPRAVVHGR